MTLILLCKMIRQATPPPAAPVSALTAARVRVRTDAFPNLAGRLARPVAPGGDPAASAEFAFERQQLRLSIPQAAVDSHAPRLRRPGTAR